MQCPRPHFLFFIFIVLVLFKSNSKTQDKSKCLCLSSNNISLVYGQQCLSWKKNWRNYRNIRTGQVGLFSSILYESCVTFSNGTTLAYNTCRSDDNISFLLLSYLIKSIISIVHHPLSSDLFLVWTTGKVICHCTFRFGLQNTMDARASNHLSSWVLTR